MSFFFNSTFANGLESELGPLVKWQRLSWATMEPHDLVNLADQLSHTTEWATKKKGLTSPSCPDHASPITIITINNPQKSPKSSGSFSCQRCLQLLQKNLAIGRRLAANWQDKISCKSLRTLSPLRTPAAGEECSYDRTGQLWGREGGLPMTSNWHLRGNKSYYWEWGDRSSYRHGSNTVNFQPHQPLCLPSTEYRNVAKGGSD